MDVIHHRGGIQLTFSGSNLDIAQNPFLVVDDSKYLSSTKVSERERFEKYTVNSYRSKAQTLLVYNSCNVQLHLSLECSKKHYNYTELDFSLLLELRS